MKQTPQKRVLLLRILAPILLVLFGVIWTLYLGIALPAQRASAATDSTINFQARLLTGAGAIVADGTYNVEFKIYNTLSTGGTGQGVCTGNCQWLETRTGGNQVTVKAGYLTVNLGSVTGFSGSINWDQDLYLTMNVGGTGGSPSWDGEMTPRIHLTAVPYAFRAGALASLSGSNTAVLQFAGSIGQNTTITLPDPGASTATVCYQAAAACGFTTGSGAAVQLQGSTPGSAQTGNFNITGTGIAGILQAATFDTASAGTLSIGTTNATSIALNQNTTVATNKSFTANGSALFQDATSSATAFQIQSVTGVQLFNVDSTTDASNLVTNGNFEPATGVTGWVAKNGSGTSAISAVTTQAYLGQGSMQIATTGANSTNGGATYNVTLSNTTQYTLTFFAKLNSGTMADLQAGYSSTGLAGGESNCTLNSATLVTGGWTRFTCTFTTAGSHSGTPYIYITQSGSTNHTYFVDAVKLEQAAAATPYREGVISLNGVISSPTVFKNQSDSTTAFQIQNAAGTSNLFVADTLNGRIGIGTISPAYPLDVVGDINSSTGLRVAGTLVCDSTGCTAKTGSGFYIHNQTTVQAANFFVQAASSGSVAGVLQANASGSGDILDLQNGSGTLVATFGSTGNVLIQPSTNSVNAFQIQTAGGSPITLFGVDTSGANVNIGATGSAALASNVNIGTSSGGIQTIIIGSTNSSSALTLQAGTGNLSITTQGTGTLGIGNNAVAQNIAIGNTTLATGITERVGTGNYSLNGVGASTYAIGAATVGGTITFGGTTETGTLTLGQSTATNIINIGNATTATGNTQTINIGTSATGTGLTALTIGDTNGLSTLTLQGGTGTGGTPAISLATGATGGVAGTITVGNLTGANSQTINIGTNATASSSTNVTIGSTIAGTILLQGSGATQTITGSTDIIMTSTNVTNAFQVQNSSGYALLNIDTSTQGSNLVTNSNFETNTSGWATKGTGATLTQVTTQAYTGNGSMQVATTGSFNAGASYNFTLSATTQYSLTLYLKASGSNFSTINMGRQDQSGTDIDCLTGIALVTNGWTQFSCSFTTGGTISSSNIYIKDTGSNHTFFVDAVQLIQANAKSPYNQGGQIGLNGIINTPVVFQNTTDSNVAFTVATATGKSIFIVDTLNRTVNIGATSNLGQTSTVNIATSTNNNTQIVNIGSAANTSSTLTLDAGTASTAIQIGNSDSSHGIQIGTVATSSSVETISIGATNSTSSTTITGGTGAGAITLQTGSGGTILIGAGSAVYLGTATNGVQIDATNHQLRLLGSARNTRRIRLNAEYPGAVLDPGSGSNNTGTMTAGYDSTNRMNYYNWVSGQGTNQSYDIVVQVPIPYDFVSFVSTSSWGLSEYSYNNGTNTVQVQVTDSAGTVGTMTDITNGTGLSWNIKSPALLSGVFTAGDYMTIRIRLTEGLTAANARIGNIYLDYVSNF